MELNNLSSNWKRLQETLKNDPGSSAAAAKCKSKDTASHGAVKRRRIVEASSSALSGKKPGVDLERKPSHKRRKMWATPKTEVVEDVSQVKDGVRTSITVQTTPPTVSNIGKINEGLSATAEVGKYLAIDCEMVGVGPNPDADSALARVSIVNFNGDQVYDSFVRPKEMVTDWRTHVSGISAKHMTNARSFEEVQRDVAKLLDGCILVGHAVRNDLDALLLGHPKRDIRDTSKYPPYRKLAGGGSPRLKILASELLGLEIQGGAHSSVEDARATMLLFRRDKDGFEREHAKKWPVRVPVDGESNGNGKKKKHKKKKGRK